MRRLVAIDPGEKHCGVVELYERGGAWQYMGDMPMTLDPLGLADYLEQIQAEVEVVLEEYRLYPWLLQQQGYSQVLTVEVIGVVRHICRRRRWKLTMQPATIKEPTAGWMRRRLWKHAGANQHERDAELHAFHYLLREDMKCTVVPKRSGRTAGSIGGPTRRGDSAASPRGGSADDGVGSR